MNEAGTSSTLTFDAYGGVLDNTLPTEMQTALAGQGVLAEVDTGLIHQGGGRFYDPALGRPLQPNAFGGIPTVPQSLNRYGATSMGAPGVAEGAWDPFTDPVASNIGKSAIVAASLVPWQGVEYGLAAYSRASWQKTQVEKIRFRRVPISQRVDDVILRIGVAGKVLKDWIGAPAGSNRSQFFSFGSELFMLSALLNSRFVPERYSSYVMRHRYPGGWLAGAIARRLGGLVDELGVSTIINVGYQLWLDHDNPYLDLRQKTFRSLTTWGAASVSAALGYVVGNTVAGAIAGPWGAAAGFVSGVVVGIGVSIGLDVTIVPAIYEGGNLHPNRNLVTVQN